ncbi:MAG TPA: hypothetical protein VFR90_10640 [Methylibium sp.]|uniref:hypothetical protein n=1 Tax=Methylibium sp. TaxID=2067992 RepID=UPI002DBE163B|nr:hypothetical protein [Methylibium sp.]HEU4459570.1 hypothetical protein [Methylibium sp.]
MIPEIAANQILERATMAPGHATEALSSRFAELMAHEPAQPMLAPVGSPNVASHVVERYELGLRDLFNEVQSFSVQAPRMDPHELVGRQIELQYHMAQVAMQNNGVIYAAQSSKNGLSTLMKNQ